MFAFYSPKCQGSGAQRFTDRSCRRDARNRALELVGDALILRDLRCVARLIGEISAHYDQGGMQAVRGPNRELEVGGLLGEVADAIVNDPGVPTPMEDL